MGITRFATKSPRTFVLGLSVGVVLISTGFLLAMFATGQAGAQNAGGTVPACVNFYTGAVRMGYPGQPPNCSQAEYLIELNTGSPAANISFAVRTVEDDVSNANFFGTLRTVDCEPGEIAINGGSRLKVDGNYVNSTAFESGADGPIGSPPTGWMSGFEYNTGSPQPDRVVETWALCIS